MTSTPITDALRYRPGTDLADLDTRATPGFDGDKDDAAKELPDLAPEMADLQEKLFAAGYTGSGQRLLLVLQGMDTAGKGGILRHAVGLLDPGGMRLKAFKKPTQEELAHDFLWRVSREVPAAGEIGIFDRSHYEDVLVVKVHELTDAAEIERRYDAINAFEKNLVDSGTVMIKCMLHISKDTQKERLLARLEDRTKQWKFKPEDIDERGHWDEYQAAYATALERCSTAHAPWYVVPSDRKWYRNWAIGQLLREALRAMDLDWPTPDYDVEEQRARLENEREGGE
ncbi:PPK2 family polyphosphate kinase [Marmoricola sp. RAF53]|uniref:PPK2 family polyphosphate kinase n=1 Tax=Marmoricola sp. RAF53 TaxID=3233059 RepID=UPI003F9BD9FB